MPTSRWATAWRRCSRLRSRPAAAVSAACAMALPGMTTLSSATVPWRGAPGLYDRPGFRAGRARLAALGLSFDAWIFYPQIAEVVDLARAFPQANIILCHMGGPLGYGPYAGRQKEVFATWKAAMTELSTCPNVSVKLGGLTTRLAADDYMKMPAPPSSAELADYWRPYASTCIELF